MAQEPAVHIEPRGEGWAVVREGNTRATSVHPTQSEAAEVGRDLAREDRTEFFLHGQVGEHRDYGEGEAPEDQGIVEKVSETVTDLVGDTTGVASQAVSSARQETEVAPDRRVGQREGRADVGSSGERASEDEVRGEQIRTPEERYADYGIYDRYGERIGPLNDLFVDER